MSEEASGIVKVARDSRFEDTVRASIQSWGLRNSGWDFSIGGSTSTETIRSAVKPPQVRDRKAEAPLTQSSSRKISHNSNQRATPSGSIIRSSSEVSVEKDTNHLRKQKNYLEEDDMNSTGTVVVRSPKGN